ncbi:hypothetical protein Glove_688g32 [Diversispora epigaea]|uniref:DNA polymerase delta subunit 3 n=1 Tax=Diversispora epigaea TaxID=1348612 RepID=A0A397G2H5_9GLOM|nr:hypothetical protein Glove_688g32 [Diversispora epigaea]
MSSTENLDKIRNFVFNDKKIVTYKWLSRYLEIPTNQAKQLLFETISLSSVPIHATYCLSGISNDDCHKVKLVVQEELEEIKQRFKKLTSIHIYSVEAHCPKDESAMVSVNREIKKGFAFIKPIKLINKEESSIIEFEKSEDKILLNETLDKNKEPVSSTSKHKIVEPVSSKHKNEKPNSSKRKNEEEESISSKHKKKSTFFEKRISPNKKEAVNKTSKDSENPIESSEPILVQNPKEEIQTKSKKRKSIDIENDSDQNLSSDPILEQSELSTPLSSFNLDLNRSSSILSDRMDIDQNPPSNEQLVPPQRKRGRRKVLKQKTHKNERGFLVNEDVYEWESFSEEESVPKQPTTNENPKEKEIVKSTKTKRVKRKGNEVSSQKSLLSFFGKS